MKTTYRRVSTGFWKEPTVLEEMSFEEKVLLLFLQTNSNTSQIGIYKISKKEIAFQLGLTCDMVETLMDRLIQQHQVIRYNPETREVAIKNWGKTNLNNNGKPFMDCVFSELQEVEDLSLIPYVAESIPKKEIQHLFLSFCGQGGPLFEKEENGPEEIVPYIESNEFIDRSALRDTLRGQEKEEGKEKEEEKMVHSTRFKLLQEAEDAKEIVAFWDNNGFGFGNVVAKEKLLAWLDDSHFLNPEEMILKAMNIACANNKRSLSYVVAILKNWENQSLLTVEEVEYAEKRRTKQSKSIESHRSGRDIPSEFVLDITAGED